MVDLLESRRTAAHLVAAAALELFPKTVLVGGAPTSLGFYYDFIFPFAFQDSFIPMLEERCRLILREKRKIAELTMVPQSGSALLASRGHSYRAEAALESDESLITLIKWGEGFVDLTEGTFAKECGIVKLLETSSIGEITRIWGTAFFKEEDLKKFLKHRDVQQHPALGKVQNLFSEIGEEAWVWHPKGEALRQQLYSWWREIHRQQNFQFISAPIFSSEEERVRAAAFFFKGESIRLALWTTTQSPEKRDPFGGLLDPPYSTTDYAYRLCFIPDLLKECISSLQFLIEIFKILRFEYDLLLTEGKHTGVLREALKHLQLPYKVQEGTTTLLEFYVCDNVGRRWLSSCMCIGKLEGDLVFVQHRAFVSLERTIALLVEKNLEQLPLWLAPEQVRVLAMRGQEEEAQKIVQSLSEAKVRVHYDNASSKLGKRMHEALRERVPYCIVVGEREKRAGMLTMRTPRSEVEEQMSLPLFIDKLRQEWQFESQ